MNLSLQSKKESNKKDIKNNQKSWKNVKTKQHAFDLIDLGVLVKHKEIVSLKKLLNTEDEELILSYFAERFAERYSDRDAAEIILESLIRWLSLSCDDTLIVIFLRKIFEHPDSIEIIKVFPGLCLSLELAEKKNIEQIYDLSVFIISQMGIQINHLSKVYPEQFASHLKIINHISTYMLSVGNINSFTTRLCLLNYFATIDIQSGLERNFNKIMGRFGSTLLNQLFSCLAEKKMQCFALNYLLKNLPIILLTGDKTQETLHDVLRFNMLKYPLKFSLFIKIFSEDLKSNLLDNIPDNFHHQIIENYLKHLVLLLKVIAKVDHHHLSKEVILSIFAFDNHPYGQNILEQLKFSNMLRPYYRNLIKYLSRIDNKRKYLESSSKFNFHKKGRKPSLKKDKCSDFEVMYVLGKQVS